MILEIVEARLKPTISKEMFQEKSEAMYAFFLKGRVGFLHRYVWLSDDRRCGAILTWRSQSDATNAMTIALDFESVHDFASCFEDGSYSMSLVPLLEENSI